MKFKDYVSKVEESIWTLPLETPIPTRQMTVQTSHISPVGEYGFETYAWSGENKHLGDVVARYKSINDAHDGHTGIVNALNRGTSLRQIRHNMQHSLPLN